MIKILRHILVAILTFTIINTFTVVNINAIETEDKIYKVGFYRYDPYYLINDKGDVYGYYEDILKELSKDLNIKYEYIDLGIKESIKSLESGEIDLMIGLSMTDEREEKFIYTDHYITTEKYGIYTDKNIEYGKLEELENLRFGVLEKEANSEWALNFLEKKNINIKPVIAKTYKEMKELLIEGKADAVTASITNSQLKNYNKIYEYSTGPVYIATSKNNAELANRINEWLKLNASKSGNENVILKTHSKYFGKLLNNKEVAQVKVMVVVVCLLLLLIIYFKAFPKIKIIIAKKRIRDNINSDRFFVQYQPIVNPKKYEIVGFEALTRLNDPKKGIISPYIFIKEIEKYDMMSEFSIWILNKILNDYKDIKPLNNKIRDDYYVSMNLTTDIIESMDFVEKVKGIVGKSDIEANNICMEIVETHKINDLKKITASIKELKDIGIKIAIDDFGVEYSNLDIIEKIDFDIMKLDKYFVDGIENSKVKIEIIKFLSNIAKVKQSYVVAEGIENKSQKDIIKNIDNNKFYIQGYYYSKPVDKNEIKNISL